MKLKACTAVLCFSPKCEKHNDGDAMARVDMTVHYGHSCKAKLCKASQTDEDLG